MAKALNGFRVSRSAGDYLIQIDDEDGDTTEFTADFDQIEEMIEELESLIGDDEDDVIADDEDDDDPREREDD